MITNQRELRRAFWAANPELSRKKIADYTGKRGGMYACDTRVAWVDYIDQMERAGQILPSLAQRATLGGG